MVVVEEEKGSSSGRRRGRQSKRRLRRRRRTPRKKTARKQRRGGKGEGQKEAAEELPLEDTDRPRTAPREEAAAEVDEGEKPVETLQEVGSVSEKALQDAKGDEGELQTGRVDVEEDASQEKTQREGVS